MARLKLNLMQRCVVGAALTSLSAAASAETFPPAIIGGVYQQSTNTISTTPPDDCGINDAVCNIVFSRVPPGKELVITNVSCSFRLVGEIERVYLIPQRPAGDFEPRTQFLQAAAGPASNYSLNNTTLATFGPRQRPIIRLETSQLTGVAANCTIAGQLTDAPP